MITRITFPDRASFSTSNGYAAPFYDKFTTPKFAIRYADNVNTGRNPGMDIHWYMSSADARLEKSTVYSGWFPIAKFYYANGYPPFYSNPDPKANWACKIKTYMFFNDLANYTFYLGGSGAVESVTIDGVEYLTKQKILRFSDTNYSTTTPYQEAAGQVWRKITMTYSAGKRLEPAINEYGFIAMFNSDVPSYPDPIPLSAYWCAPFVYQPSAKDVLTIGQTLNWSTVLPVIDITYSVTKDSIASLKFSVPFIHTSNYAYNGYFHSAGNLIYITDRSRIKPYRMVEYYEGYATANGGSEYVRKFTGQIKSFSSNYDSNGIQKIDVQCEDFSSFLKESFNLYSPTPLDYIQVGYMNPRTYPFNRSGYNKLVDGYGKPNTFDGWDIYKFVQIILTEAGIDPVLFYQQKTFSNRSAQAVTGNYKMLFTEATSNSVILPVNLNYGNLANINEKADDRYNYSIGTGEFFYDVLQNTLKPYYYGFYFDEAGHPVINGYNIPTTIKDDAAFTKTVGWGSGTNYNAFQTTYSSANNSATHTAGINFTGAACDVVFVTNPRTGSKNSYKYLSTAKDSVKMEIKNASGTLYTWYAKLYSSTSRGYYDGVDAQLGFNPCVVHLSDQTMLYDNYRLVVTPQNGLTTNLDAILIYDKDYAQPTQYLESDDSNLRGTIVNMSLEDQMRDLRNDVYVYGNLIGDIAGTNNSDTKVTINPNNPIYRYNYAIARDIGSMYSSAASNYIGRPIRMLIQDPKIVNQEQADSISYNVLYRYRQPNKKTSLTILGNPLIQIDDCLGIKDNYIKYISTSEPVWVEDIRTQIETSNDGRIRYLTQLQTTPVQPPDSWWPKPDPYYTGNAIRNVMVRNQGRMIQLNAAISSSQSSFVVKATPSAGVGWSRWGILPIPEKGYMRLFHTTSVERPNDPLYTFETTWNANEYPYRSEEIIYYEKADLVSTGTTVTLQNVKRGCWGSLATSHAANCKFYAAVDPYSADAFNVYPSITFDCMASGKLRVQVWGMTDVGPKLVDTLTGIDDKNWPFTGYDDVKWGRYTYYWSCIDQIGQYNEIATNGEVRKGGFYASENEIDASEEQLKKTSEATWIGGHWENDRFGNQRWVQGHYSNNTYSYQRYVAKDTYLKDGKFYFIVELITSNKQVTHKYETMPQISSLSMDTSMGLVYIKRSPTGAIGMSVATAGLYIHWGDSDKTNRMQWLATAKSAGNVTWSSFGFLYNSAAPLLPEQSGINVTFYDYSPGVYTTSLGQTRRVSSILEKSATRQYLMDVNYNIVTYVWCDLLYGSNPDDDDLPYKLSQWFVIPATGKLTNNNWIEINNKGEGRKYIFNPKTRHEDVSINFFPVSVRDQLAAYQKDWKAWVNGPLSSRNFMMVNHVIYFSGFIYDKSGRNVWIMQPLKTNLRYGNQIALNNMFDKESYSLLPKKERNILHWQDIGKSYMYRIGKSVLEYPAYLVATSGNKLAPFSKNESFAELLQWTGGFLWWDRDLYSGRATAGGVNIFSGYENPGQFYGQDPSLVTTNYRQCGNKRLYHADFMHLAAGDPRYLCNWVQIPNATIAKVLGVE